MLPVLLIVALVASLVLVEKSQELRKGAYFAGAKVSVLPGEITAVRGQAVPVQLWVESDSETAKVDGLQTQLCYGTGLSLDESKIDSLVTLNSEAGFNSMPLATIENNCLKIAISSDKGASALKAGLVQVATIRFTAAAAGSGKIELNIDKTKVSGNNPTGGTDKAMKVGSVIGASYTINSAGIEPTSTKTPVSTKTPTKTPVPASTEYPEISFKMSFQGVNANAKCANDLKISVMVLGGGTSKKTYPATATKVESGTDKAVYLAEVKLDGFNYNKDVAVFVKGPKHIQTKYGVDGQKDFYNMAGGQLDLTDSGKIFDFSNYPLLAGDVTGDTVGVPDGVIDGRDFSYIKSEVEKRTEVAEGGSMQADLNGNCKLESQDIAIMMLSLKEKQAQLY